MASRRALGEPAKISEKEFRENLASLMANVADDFVLTEDATKVSRF